MVNYDTTNNQSADNGINCIQINLGRGKRATQHLLEKIVRDKIKIVFIQEPYVVNSKVCGFPSRYKIFYDVNNPRDNPIRCAIVITDNNLRGTLIADKCNENLLTVEIKNNYGINVTCASMYFPPEERHQGEFRDNLQYLKQVITGLNNNRISKFVIRMDANSKNGLWGSPIEDRRGRQLEDLINEKNLVVLNNNTEPTFVGHRGTSFIDVTLANQDMYEIINDWKLTEDESLSEHKYISFAISDGRRAETEPHRTGYCTKRANWTRFREIIAAQADTLIREINECETTDGLDSIAKEISDTVVNACDRSMPRRKAFQNSVPWWTPELTEFRRETNKARRRFQRSANAEERNERGIVYREKFNEYKMALQDTRVKKWKEFCTRSGGTDPWGLAYRAVRREHNAEVRRNVHAKRRTNGGDPIRYVFPIGQH